MKKSKLNKLKRWMDQFNYKCKEGCYECCTSVPMLEEEVKVIKKELTRQGYKKPPNGKGGIYCEMLTKDGKCSVYNVRPIVCRSFSDRVFIMKNRFKKIGTQSCTYGKPKHTQVIQEYNEYGEEVITKGVILGMNPDKLIKPNLLKNEQ